MIKGLIILDPHPFELIYGERLKNDIAHRVQLLSDQPLTKAQIAADPSILSEVEVVFSGWGAPVMDEAFLAAAPKLKAVFYGAGSIRGFATDAFWARNITVTSAYAMNAVPVSEFTLAAILLSLKNAWRYMLGTKRDGAFPDKAPCAGAYGSKVGLVSLGMIGRLVRERLRPFDVEVLAYDPFVTREQAAALNVEIVSLEEIFKQCDVVSLHTPWLKETERMITGAHFRSMKPGAAFINTARGAVVCEDQLIDVLGERPDLTAMLDVTYPDEPPQPGSPLFTLPNVILTPHIAGSMDLECRRMGQLMIEEFDRWAHGDSLKWGLTKEKAATLA
ncbi:MAG: hydroxyacid dehydrogenase [Verrucomicrobiota bacterium]